MGIKLLLKCKKKTDILFFLTFYVIKIIFYTFDV